MIKRIISGVAGALFVVFAVIFNQSMPILINILVTLVCISSIYEIFAAMGLSKKFIIIIPSLLFALVIPFIWQTPAYYLVVYIYTLIMLCSMIFLHKTLNFKDISVAYVMTLLITISLSTIIKLRDMGGESFGAFFIIIVLGLPWLADTGAYFIGSFFGKHKLCPTISPKKTIEGAIGGMVFGISSVFVFYFIFNTWLFKNNVEADYISLLCLGIIGSVLAIFGDLCFSFVKRGCHIKDFGNVIPGHGGLLDRFDSVIFVAPLVYFFMHFLPFINI